MTARAARPPSPFASEAAFQSAVVRMARDAGWGIPESAWRRQQEEAEQWSRLSGDAGILDEAARLSGLVYHARFSLGSESGWPDCCFIRRKDRRVLFVEFKSEKGRLTPRQSQVLDLLREVGFDARCWRPSDLESGEVLDALR